MVEYMDLAKVLARYFVQNRPSWQKSMYVEDLESEGLLALTKAARTYDKKRLPYPKAYFARAAMNAMYKHIKKATRQPAERKVTLQEAADATPHYDEIDHLRMAIESLPEEDQELAWDRFHSGATLRTLAERHQLPLRVASLRSQRLSKELAQSLDIRLKPRDASCKHLRRNSSPRTSRGSQASSRSSSQKPKRFPGK